MTTLYQKALLDLKRVEGTLRNELAGVDLDQLAAASEAYPVSQETAAQWRDVLTVLAIPLQDFGASVRSADAYMVQQYSSSKTFCRMLTLLQAVVVVMIFIAIAKNYVEDLISKDIVWTSVKAGTLISIAVIVLTVTGVWRQGMLESIRKIEFDQASPTAMYMHRFQSRLSNQVSVMVMAALVSGRDPTQLLLKREELTVASLPPQCKAGYLSVSNDNVQSICSSATGGTLTLEGSTQLFTDPNFFGGRRGTKILKDMAAAMMELRTRGADVLDHVAMWRCVDQGLNEVRTLVMRSNDGEKGAFDTEDFVRNEIVPLLRVNAAMFRNAFKLDSSAAGKMWKRVVTEVDGQPLDRAGCFAMCQASHDSRMAYFTPAKIVNGVSVPGKCMLTTGSADEVKALANARFYGRGAGEDSLMVKGPAADGEKKGGNSSMVCAPTDRRVILEDAWNSSQGKSTTQGAFTCVELPEENMYAAAAGEDGQGIADLIRTMSSQIADSVVQVLRRMQFRIDITAPAYKDIVDAELLTHYGAKAYDANIRDAISDVFNQINVQVRQMSLPAARALDMAFVTPQRLLDKVAAMSETDLLRTQRSLSRLASCTRDHAAMFPAYSSTMSRNVVDRVSISSNLVALVGFSIFMVVLYAKGTFHSKENSTVAVPLKVIIRYMAYGLCGLSILLITIDTLMHKSLARTQHNWKAIEANGNVLVASTDRMSSQFEVMLRAAGRGADGAGGIGVDATRVRSVALSGLELASDNRYRAQAAATAFLAEARTAFDKYAECNSIVNGKPKMPMPLAETLMYVLVGLGFVVVSFYVIKEIAPSQRILSLRMLYDMKARVGRGDPEAIAGAHALLKCAAPMDSMWDILTWFWIVTLVVVTLWFLLVSLNVVKDYSRTLEVSGSCDGSAP
jgi:hypothetical protein